MVSGLPALPILTMQAVLDADVGLDDAPVIEDERVGDHQVERYRRARCAAALAHAVADHLAAAELDLVAVDGEVLLDFDDQFGVGQADAVAGGGAVEVGVAAAVDLVMVSAAARRSPAVVAEDDACPAQGMSATFPSPGSKRMAVPAADVETHAVRGVAIELQSGVHFGEMEVRADLDGAVAGVGDVERSVVRPAFRTSGPSSGKISPGVMDRMVDRHELRAVWERRLDLDFVDHLGDAVHHSSRRRMCLPALISSATERPSRAPSKAPR